MKQKTKSPRPTPEPAYLRPADVTILTGIPSPATLRNMARNGEFPAPVKLGKRAIGYRRADVLEWIDSRPLA